eukprot:gene7938-8793_t
MPNASIFTALCCYCAWILLVQGENTSLKEKMVMNTTQAMDWTWSTMMSLYNNSFPGTEPTGDFLGAAFEITKSVARAHAAAQRSPDEAIDIRELGKYMKLATTKKNMPYARSALGRTLYRYFLSYLDAPGNLPLKVEAISLAASEFLESLKDDVGSNNFDRLVARGGGKTLAFAVDTTGSMTDDIKAAKAIAKAIVNENREQKVDYILSPFGDPTYGPTIYKSEDKGKEFVSVIDSISPRGGGDCQELTYTGILEALNSGPQYGSPLFVITDASAKDDTDANIKTAKVIAQSTGITINFLTKASGCDDTGIEKFKELASFTSGQVFPLKSDDELKNLTHFVRDSLENTQVLSTSSFYSFKRRGARSIFKYNYPLNIDEFVTKLQVTVTTERENQGQTSLLDPTGIESQPWIRLAQTTYYSVKKPMPGEWTLVVPKSVGKFDYVARVKSDKVIQFGYFFVFVHNGISSLIAHPIVDEMCTAYISVGGAHHTDISTLSLRLINNQGHTLMKGIKLIPLGSSGVHFKVSFTPPGKSTFKVVLQGKTKRGNKFTRVSKQEVTAKGLLLIALYGQGEFTAIAGRRMLLVVGLHNGEGTDFFKIKAYTSNGAVRALRDRVMARKGRLGFTTLVFVPKKTAKHGSTVTLFVTARGERSGRFVSEIIRLIVIRPYRFG